NFADLDDLVRQAAMNGMTVMLTIWGTPAWANHARGPNYVPDQMNDLYAFTLAVADRYSGRHPGFPFVGFYTVWNEPNSARFLAPTFDAAGNPVSPYLYATLGYGPRQRYRFPNVNLSTLRTFEQKLDLWFHRSDIPIWISEYGLQTRPARPGGVTVRQQAAYVRQALAIAAADPRVQMF